MTGLDSDTVAGPHVHAAEAVQIRLPAGVHLDRPNADLL